MRSGVGIQSVWGMLLLLFCAVPAPGLCRSSLAVYPGTLRGGGAAPTGNALQDPALGANGPGTDEHQLVRNLAAKAAHQAGTRHSRRVTACPSPGRPGSHSPCPA